MATDILIKRSTTSGAIPTTGDLSTGELAINTADKRLFTNNSGTIVEIGTAPTSLAVTNNATVGGTLGVTGNTTLSGTLSAGASTLASGSVTGNFSVAGTLTVATPSNSTDAASKGYVDTAVANVIDSAPGALDTLNELAAAINDDANFATTITNSIATKLALAGGTMTGDITMGANKVTSTATPSTDDDLTRKAYVDSILGSATSAATSATAAASSATDAANSASAASTSASNASTSATNAATSASNASTSETNAATSASSASSSATASANSATAAATSASNAATSEANAAASYDSFDDRYLGAKASDPSVDNDGDALITGALYFDSTNGVMKVYNGSEWASASSSIEGIKSDFVYTATASQTAFSGADDNTNTLVIDQAGLVNVFFNGVRLLETTDYTVNTSTNTVTLVSGAELNDIIEIEVFGNFAGQSGAEVAITGGNIDGTTIGGTTPAAGSFTTLSNTGNATLQNLSSTNSPLNISSSASDGSATLDASGNLLVGTTSDEGDNGITLGTDGRLYAAVTSNQSIFNRLSTDGDIVRFQKDGSTVGSIGVLASNNLYIAGQVSGHAGVAFESNVFVPLNAGSRADDFANLGESTHRFKDAYLSGGVYIGDTGSANYLDDYEEGTWTPDLLFGGGSTGIAYSERYGSYTKIGNRVTVDFYLLLSNKGSSSGQAVVSGLPFPAKNDETGATRPYSAGLLVDEGSGSSWPQTTTYALAWSDSDLYLRYNDGSGFSSISNSNFTNSSSIYLTVTYRVA